MNVAMSIKVNGQQRAITTDRGRPLLDVLREDLQLTGTKYGCGQGDCGACAVLVDGKEVRSCSIAIEDVADREIVTVEGLAAGEALHPAQRAFADESAFQCGYCTPGMIVATAALLKEKPNPSDDEIRESMNGHLCRCCGYEKILNAVRRAARPEGS